MKTEKPWPDYPPEYKERVIIQRAFQFYFTCEVCKQLGWDKDCKSKDACGQLLYQKMTEHCKKWEKLNGSANSVGISRN